MKRAVFLSLVDQALIPPGTVLLVQQDEFVVRIGACLAAFVRADQPRLDAGSRAVLP